MAKNLEIERKFLVKYIPDSVIITDTKYITQGYLFVGNDREMRIRYTRLSRSATASYFKIGIKTGTGLVRGESEISIDFGMYNALRENIIGNLIHKTRIRIGYNGYDIEVDKYTDNLLGLIIAEVEFASIEESKKFNPPDWFDKEVTNNIDYKNSRLAINGMPSNSIDTEKK